MSTRTSITLGHCLLVGLMVANAAAATVEYNRDVRPILSDKCFKCHGFDPNTRKAKLRLDVREEALKPAKSGELPIVPGKPEASAIILRIESADPDEVMPPSKDHAPLKAGEIAILKQWIAEGPSIRLIGPSCRRSRATRRALMRSFAQHWQGRA